MVAVNFFAAIVRRLGLWLAGLAALGRLIGIGIMALFGGAGTARERLTTALTAPDALRLAFEVLRAFVPNLVLRKKFVTAYDNSGTALVTRFEDVHDVLDRDKDFEVVYEPRMREITAGDNF